MSITDDTFLITSYLNLMRARSENTYRNMKTAFRQFFKYINKPIAEITVKDAYEFFTKVLDPSSLKISSKKCRRHQLSGFFEYVKEMHFKEGKIYHNPIPSERLCPFTKTEQDITRQSHKNLKILTKEQLQEILDYSYNRQTLRDFLLLSIQISSGPRISETRTILQKDVHLQERYFETGFIKDARKTTLYKEEGLLFFLPKGLFLEVLEQYLDSTESKWLFPGYSGSSLAHATVYTIIKGIRKDLGFEFGFHYFRRTLITERMKMGCPEWISEALQNHAASTTERESYIKLSLEEKRLEYDKYFPYKNIYYFK